MARYEHLPIFRAAFDLAVHIEKIVHHFSRYHKYTLGTELRNRSRLILEEVVAANAAHEGRKNYLLKLRQDLEALKIMARLCHESGGFSGIKAYLHVSEMIVNIARQNEGWLKQTAGGSREPKKEGMTGAGPNRQT